MPWTVEHRLAADRRGLHNPSDPTDDEWALLAPLIRPAKRGGRRRSMDVRDVERSIGWFRRDFARHCRSACAFVRMAPIRIMLRRLAAMPSA